MPNGGMGNMLGPQSGLNAAIKEKEFPNLGTNLEHLIQVDADNPRRLSLTQMMEAGTNSVYLKTPFDSDIY